MYVTHCSYNAKTTLQLSSSSTGIVGRRLSRNEEITVTSSSSSPIRVNTVIFNPYKPPTTVDAVTQLLQSLPRETPSHVVAVNDKAVVGASGVRRI